MTLYQEQALLSVHRLRGKADPKSISRKMKVTEEFASRLCDGLVEGGFLSKEDEGGYTLTPLGEKALSPLNDANRQMLRLILKGAENKEAISSLMKVSSKFVGDACEFLAETGYLTISPEETYALTPRGERVLRESSGLFLVRSR